MKASTNWTHRTGHTPLRFALLSHSPKPRRELRINASTQWFRVQAQAGPGIAGNVGFDLWFVVPSFVERLVERVHALELC